MRIGRGVSAAAEHVFQFSQLGVVRGGQIVRIAADASAYRRGLQPGSSIPLFRPHGVEKWIVRSLGLRLNLDRAAGEHAFPQRLPRFAGPLV